MAMPFIIHHNESIYSLEEKEKKKLKKPPRYHSTFEKQARLESKINKDIHKTMGYAEIPLDRPENYLKIGGGVRPKLNTKDHGCYRIAMPVIPSVSNKRPQTSTKDFRKENIRAVVKSAPSRPMPRYVDTKNGDFHDLKKSGLMPTYIYQDKFGKLPKYLIKRIRDTAMEEENVREEEVRRQPLCRYVTQDERAKVLEGLKHNWQELQRVYQGLSVLTDTIPKSIRKTKLENNLKQLEKDILLIENHPYIYVYDDDESNNNNQKRF